MNDFSSMDRLMELGMSMALANQMIGTMNQAMNNMQVPGRVFQPSACTQQQADQNNQTTQSSQDVPPEIQATYAVIDGHMAGPLTDKQLSQLIQIGTVNLQTLVWRPGLPEWKYAADVPEIYKIILLST